MIKRRRNKYSAGTAVHAIGRKGSETGSKRRQGCFGDRSESAEILKSIVNSEFDSELSKASLETLSIIIYKGATSRAEIDYIRGVNSSFILRNLLVRGLIEREAKRGEDKSYVYKPSLNLLEHLGVMSLEELPEYSSMSAKLKEFLNAEKKK